MKESKLLWVKGFLDGLLSADWLNDAEGNPYLYPIIKEEEAWQIIKEIETLISMNEE